MSTHTLRTPSMTRNGSVPKDLFEVMAGATACSLRVFHGLLAWANLNAQIASKPEITTGTARHAKVARIEVSYLPPLAHDRIALTVLAVLVLLAASVRAGGRRAQPVGGARSGLHDQRQLLRAQESRDLTARGGLYDPCMPPGTRSR
jgi:hypothetical protein